MAAKGEKDGPAAKALRVAIVGGAGHVGLPLALVLVERGHHVFVVDDDEARLKAIRDGSLPFLDRGGPGLLERCLNEHSAHFDLTTDLAAIQGCDVVVVTAGTPVDEHLNPHFSVVEACVRRIRPFIRNGQTLMLRSTVFPGTSARILGLLRNDGLDVSMSFCPARLAHGYLIEELTEVPQIISGSDSRALAHAEALFRPLDVDLVVLELREAEVSKLFLNSWRYVVFGIANQFYQIATSKGLNFDKIRAAIMHRYKRADGFPHAGFTAGPNLFTDTMQLAAFCRHTFTLGHAAMLVNETMPDCVVEQAKRGLLAEGRTLEGVQCGILGMAFKPDNDDYTESLAFKLLRLLRSEGAEVLCTDVYSQRDDFSDVEHVLAQSELVFIGCPHSAYKNLVFRESQRVIDCWGSTSQPQLFITPCAQEREESDGDGFKSLRVAIIGGLGHVGLPLSLLLAEVGHTAIIVDIDEAKLGAVRSGNFPFLEEGGQQLLEKCLSEFPERLALTTDYDLVQDCDVIVVTIGTPVDEHLNPRFSVIDACIKKLRPLLHDGQTLLLRSTLFPGTSANIARKLHSAGLKVGVSFCPERIAQGYALEELRELPQIVSGSDPRALAHAKALFAPFARELVELELQEAELAKLFLNAWRYVVFGTANQFYHICTSKGLDFGRIRAAITHRYRRASGFPRAGFTAGPCLFKDTMQLAAYCRHAFSLGHAAMLVNETMPDCVLEQARRDLAGRSLVGMRVGILGMAFKPDNDDIRESLAFKLRRLLNWEGCEVLCADPNLRTEGLVDCQAILERCEVVFVGCPHHGYRDLPFREGQRIVDCWGSVASPELRVIAGRSLRTGDGDA